MERRDFLKVSGALGLAGLGGVTALARAAAGEGAGAAAGAMRAGSYDNVLIMIELKGGNDSLNMAIPYDDPLYYRLRPRIAIARDQVLRLDGTTGLHPAMGALMPLWQSGQLALVRGLGYPQANLSHFRSIEIWDTASKSAQYLPDGWLTRAFAARPTPARFSADGVIVGSNDLGPMAGGARAIALANTEQFLSRARLAMPAHLHGSRSLDHLLKVEADIEHAADGLRPTVPRVFKTAFPKGGFGDAVRTSMQVLANGEQSGKRVAALRLSLGSFDTHQNQPGTQAALLGQLAEGLAALRSALGELGLWERSLIMTYGEFGRRVAENVSGGTDHGTAATHLVLGGRVRGGLLGPVPELANLDGGNLKFALDFRQLYTTVLEQWWGLDAGAVLHARLPALELLRA